MKTKECRKCGEAKLLNEFGFQKRNNDGLQSYCKPCCKQANRESQIKHGNTSYNLDGFSSEKEHFNAALEQYARVFNMPNLLNYKK